MNFVKTTCIWLVAGCMSCIAAESTNESPKMWATAQTGVMSEYLGRIGTIFYDGPISATEINAGRGDWYGGLWNATVLHGERYGETYGDEWALYGGWVHAFDWLKVDASSSYYAGASLDKSGDDIWVAELEVISHKCPFVEPYVRGRYFGKVGSESPRAGFFWFAGIRKSIEFGQGLAKRPYSLNLHASTAYAAGGLHDPKGFVYGRIAGGLDIPLSKSLTLTPTVTYQVAVSGQRNDPNGFTDGNKLVGQISLKWAF